MERGFFMIVVIFADEQPSIIKIIKNLRSVLCTTCNYYLVFGISNLVLRISIPSPVNFFVICAAILQLPCKFSKMFR